MAKRESKVRNPENLVVQGHDRYLLLSSTFEKGTVAEKIKAYIKKTVEAVDGLEYKDGLSVITVKTGDTNERVWSNQFIEAMKEARLIVGVIDEVYFTREACRLEYWWMLSYFFSKTSKLFLRSASKSSIPVPSFHK